MLPDLLSYSTDVWLLFNDPASAVPGICLYSAQPKFIFSDDPRPVSLAYLLPIKSSPVTQLVHKAQASKSVTWSGCSFAQGGDLSAQGEQQSQGNGKQRGLGSSMKHKARKSLESSCWMFSDNNLLYMLFIQRGRGGQFSQVKSASCTWGNWQTLLPCLIVSSSQHWQWGTGWSHCGTSVYQADDSVGSPSEAATPQMN